MWWAEYWSQVCAGPKPWSPWMCFLRGGGDGADVAHLTIMRIPWVTGGACEPQGSLQVEGSGGQVRGGDTGQQRSEGRNHELRDASGLQRLERTANVSQSLKGYRALPAPWFELPHETHVSPELNSKMLSWCYLSSKAACHSGSRSLTCWY